MCWSFKKHDRGFLSSKSLPEHLAFVLFDHERVHRNIYSFSQNHTLRKEIRGLPDVQLRFGHDETFAISDESKTCIHLSVLTEEEQEATFSLFSILAMAYVNSPFEVQEDKGPIILPQCISIPLCKLAEELDRKPIWDYAGCVLGNWILIDKTKPISLENIKIIRTITGLLCERWFYKIHVVIEAYGGIAIKEILSIRTTIKECFNKLEYYKTQVNGFTSLLSHIETIRQSLETIAGAIQLMKLTFSRMNDNCKDKEFFLTLRPWLKGWPKTGVIYEGVSQVPVVHGGGSGAQSSLLPALDAFFGVSYMKQAGTAEKGMSSFIQTLKRFRSHMPVKHRNFLAELEAEPSFRNFFAMCNEVVISYFPKKADPEAPVFEIYTGEGVEKKDNGNNATTGQPSTETKISIPLFLKEKQRMEVARLLNSITDLKGSYNYAIENMLSFRRMHVGYATMYITRQAKKLAEKAPEEKKEELKQNAKTGTGGSSFAKHFMSHIKDTRKCLFKLDGRPRNEHEVDAELANNSQERQQFGRFETLRDQVQRVVQLRSLVDKGKENYNSDEE